MRCLVIASLFVLAATSALAQSATRVWGLYGWGDNKWGTSAGIDQIAEQARDIPGVEFVHVFNYWQTQEVANEILASPTDVKIVIYGYSCGANSMTVIAHGLDGQRNIDTLAGIQQSLWCGGDYLGGNVLFGQMTYGGCGQTLGLGCKKLMGNQSFNGTILNIRRNERHGTADNDPQYQQDILDAIYETTSPPATEPPPDDPIWHLFGHGHALARVGFVNMLKGAIMLKKGVAEINCEHNNQC